MIREIACLLNFHKRKVNTEFAKSITFLSRLNLLKLKKLTMKNQKILYSDQKTGKMVKNQKSSGKNRRLGRYVLTIWENLDFSFKNSSNSKRDSGELAGNWGQSGGNSILLDTLAQEIIFLNSSCPCFNSSSILSTFL